MPADIKFGTSGWRAILTDGFTLANVRRAVTGIAKYVASQPEPAPPPGQPGGHRVLVGRDPRFLGEFFVEEAARILARYGVIPEIIPQPAPTPAIAYAVRERRTSGAINFTASHNSSEYSGIKFSTPDGAPALPQVTRRIEDTIRALDEEGGPPPELANAAARSPVHVDVKPAYLKRLGELVDFDAIRKARLKIVFDPFWGAARGYSSEILLSHGVDAATLHDCRDVLFGGHAPEPDDPLLGDCRARMEETGAHLGIATDGDADRFGIVDRGGWFVQPNYVIALLFEYLVETRGWKNGVAKSVVTTNLIDAIAGNYGVQLYETPVGFKFIGELINRDAIAIGGEESAGLTIRGHVPEKDGVLAGLLTAEMVARRGSSLSEQLSRAFAKYGSFYPRRQNFRLTAEAKQKFTEKIKGDPGELSGRKVARVVRADGLKLIFTDGSWVCYRLSGTEPVVRIYAEGRAENEAEALNKAAADWVMQ